MKRIKWFIFGSMYAGVIFQAYIFFMQYAGLMKIEKDPQVIVEKLKNLGKVEDSVHL